MTTEELKSFITAIIEEEFTPKPIPIAKRWAGGALVLKPDNDTQQKEVPLEIFFKKLTGIRDSLRVLEQKLNTHESLSTEDKSSFQAYITKCYGSLTTFNILFKEDKDKFVGAITKEDDASKKMTVGEARRRLGLNEYGND
jgi:hypothetical protein